MSERDASAGPGRSRGSRSRIREALLEDFRRGDLHRLFRRDLRDLYDFYLDEEDRERLREMGRLRRSVALVWRLVKAAVLDLPPARRLLLLLAFLCAGYGIFAWDLRGPLWAFVLALVVLMLELKDKLLAVDELEVGRAVQLSLLPDRDPELPGWDLWLFTRPANEVGGDLIDYLPVKEDGLGVVLGDVAGKGLGAALLMAKLQATLRSLATEYDSLEELGRRMNRILVRDGVRARFTTLVYLELEPDVGRIRLLNAGHPPPLLCRSDGVESPEPVALPFGIREDAEYVQQSLELEPGDLLVVYSDGVTEARNDAGELYGEERLRRLLSRLRGHGARAAGEAILGDVEKFEGDAPRNDDLSMAVIVRS